MNDTESNLPLYLLLSALTEQATRDWLTGLYNRRYFEETLTDHTELARRYNRELSLVLFDINDFKGINDTNGHDAGDTALKQFADLLKSTARSADIVCRYGGDEFAVLLPETGKEEAKHFVERVQIRQKSPTVTAGIAALPGTDLIKEADAELMSRKIKQESPPA